MPSRSHRLLAGFLGRFALVYALLVAPWPGFNAVYGKYFRAMGQAVFARDGGRRLVRFEPVPAELRHVLDTRIALADRDLLDRNGAGPVRYLEMDTRGIGWVPTALAMALIVATPVPWSRRGWALLWGWFVVHAFLLFSTAVYIWNASFQLSLLPSSPFWQQVTDGLVETLVTQMGASFVVPVLIWIVVTLRRQDMRGWLEGGEGIGARRHAVIQTEKPLAECVLEDGLSRVRHKDGTPP
jgi:hypothetical protein